MAKREVSLVVVCEDSDHESLARRFLEKLGFGPRKISILKAPRSSGAGEQYVREAAGVEATTYRRRRSLGHCCGLVVIVDADTQSGETGLAAQRRRKQSIEQTLDRRTADKIAILVPTRNVETWIKVFQEANGSLINEEADYKPLKAYSRAAIADAAYRRWLQRRRGDDTDCPPSLADAVTELEQRLPEIDPPRQPAPRRN